MPTVTDVDNRPVAIGKWPRLRGRNSTQSNALRRHARLQPGSGNSGQGHHQHSQDQPQQHSDWCGLENCNYNCDEDSSNSCTDVLLHPELLQEFYGDKCLTSSANPLLEFCLDGGLSRKSLLGTTRLVLEEENDENNARKAQPGLLPLCSSCSDLSDHQLSQFKAQLEITLRQTGCDINVPDVQGRTPLHHLIQGCSKENVKCVLEATQMILNQSELKPDVAEFKDQDTPLTSLRHLLDRNLPQESLLHLASFYLAQFNADHINGHQRTLLTYSVATGDSVLELTRLLLNHGALVLPPRSKNTLRDRSAFTWLLKSLMREQSIEKHRDTLLLLCQNMTEVVGPEVMRTHVLSTMVHLGHSASVMAPLFLQIRSFVAPFWSQPLPLVHLARSSIRHSLGPKNVASGVTKLNLPPSLSQYLHYYFQ